MKDTIGQPGDVTFLDCALTRTYTERDKVLAERRAFVHCGLLYSAYPLKTIEEAAAARYPVPKVRRPRMVPDPDYPETRWCVRNGQIMHYDSDIKMMAYPSPERVKLWSDLLAYPTEDVDA